MKHAGFSMFPVFFCFAVVCLYEVFGIFGARRRVMDRRGCPSAPTYLKTFATDAMQLSCAMDDGFGSFEKHQGTTRFGSSFLTF